MNQTADTSDAAGISQFPFKALGGQPAFESADMQKFLAQPRIAVLSYIRSDGRPNQAPIWYDYNDDTLRMTIATGSAKHRALLKDARVCVTIQDERQKSDSTVLTLVPSEVKGFDNTRAVNRALLAGVRVRNTLPISRDWL